MKIIFTLSVIIAVLISAMVNATIINVPGDYSTIQAGINASVNSDTVLVQPGTYVENINFNDKSIVVIGDTLDNSITIIDGNALSSVVSIINGEDSTSVITGFTIQNGLADYGGGIFCYTCSTTISNNIIIGNTAYNGGGILCWPGSFPTISNNIISGNTTNNVYNGSNGGGIYCWDRSFPIISNNIIIGNSAIGNSSFGGGIYCATSSPVVFNNIIWANIAGYGLGNDVAVGFFTTPIFYYCDIQDTIEVSASFGTGVISVDPHFRDAENGDFHLMSTACGDSVDSPCIDTGDPNILDDTLDCLWGLGTDISDMGAYGGNINIDVGIEDNTLAALPDQFIIIQNYPNPFNASTNIKYYLPETEYVLIEIYDILGKKVKTLLDKVMQAGEHSVVFDADNFSSGIYFYKFDTENYSDAKSMVLIK
jgi:hypothetical protein